MAIMKEHKAFFIHIPRTGGHTIDAVLGHKRNKKVDKLKRHVSAKKYIEAFPNEWEEYFKFTFVRNPLSKVVSGWTRNRSGVNYRVNDLKNYQDDDWFYENLYLPFNRFVQKKLITECEVGHLRKQERWLFFENGEPIQFDFIGRFENFENDLRKVCRTLNVKVEEIPKISITEKRPYMEYYSSESIEIVKKLYEKEILYLGYDI